MEKNNFISQMEQIAELGNKSVTISKQDFMKLIEYSKQDKFDECFAILKELVDVKHINDTEGRTSIQYMTRQPEAWKAAKNFVSSFI
jgi:transcription elongation factor GreA-like protein